MQTVLEQMLDNYHTVSLEEKKNAFKFEQAKQDVLPFIRDRNKLNL